MTQPNIVIALADDADWSGSGSWMLPSSIVQTPTLNKLASKGTVFKHGMSSQSRCRPALASILSGLTPEHHGITSNYNRTIDGTPLPGMALDPTNALPNLLKAAGYATGGGSKFWEPAPGPGINPMSYGFDNWFNDPCREDGAAQTCSFLDACGSVPFFLWFAPMVPHKEWAAPQSMLDHYPQSSIPIPSWIPASAEGDYRREMQAFNAAMEQFDTSLGVVLQRVKDLGKAQNTVVIYLSDNGYMVGRPSKGTPYDAGQRCPMILFGPGVPVGVNDSHIATPEDVFNTITEAGIIPMATDDGEALQSVISGQATPRTSLITATYPAETLGRSKKDAAYALSYSAHDQGLHVIKWLRDINEATNLTDGDRLFNDLCAFPNHLAGDVEMFDTASNPFETTPLTAGHAAQKAAMIAALDEWWNAAPE